MENTIKIKFDNIGERVWMLETMGSAQCSKALFLACEEVAPKIAPSQELITASGFVVGSDRVPMWNRNVDTSVEVDVPKIVIDGIKQSAFAPTVVDDRSLYMIEKLSLWSVHE